MGCTSVTEQIQQIPEPLGNPIDPIFSSGNIIDMITNDPHIHFYQMKLEEVVLPLCKTKF